MIGGAERLRAKLGAQIAIAAGATLFVAGATFVLYDAFTFRAFLQRELDKQAEVIASQVSASLSFGDDEGTTAVLRALSSPDRIEVAAVCDGRGLVSAHRPAGIGAFDDACVVAEVLASTAPVYAGEEQIGLVVLRGHDGPANERTQRFVLVVAALMAPAMGLALLLAARVRATGEVFEALERALDEAKSSARAKSEFLSNMSHEIRTPLNGMVGSTELLLDSTLSDDQMELAATTNRCARALTSIVSDILEVARLDAGPLELEPRPVVLRQLVHGVVALFALDAKSKSLVVEVDVADEVPEAVLADEYRFRQMLTCLVDNAVKFTRQGGVTVRVSGSELLRFEVIDTGPGIPTERREMIFDRFQQADGSTTRANAGAGLGLAIAKSIVDRMAGSISIHAGEGGAGTRFVVEVSCPTVEAPCADASTEPAPAPRQLLLCEDNAVNRMVATRMLERLGCTVTHAVDGVEALERWTERDFDLIFMDCQMPNLDGYDATVEIRRRTEESGRRPTPIFALTANVLPEDLARCDASGMDGVVAKPVTIADLKRVLTTLPNDGLDLV